LISRRDLGLPLLFFVSLLVFQGIAFILCMNEPLWEDEAHFLDTIGQFDRDMSLSTLRHYNEMSSPLPFVLYCLWGRLFSFNIAVLRLFSVLIAFCTYILFYHLSLTVLKNMKVALLTTAFIALNPYMIGLGIFVYTDMLAILFVILSFIFLVRGKPLSLSVSLACGLLCRQYLVFLVLAALIFYSGMYRRSRGKQGEGKKALAMLGACLASLVPLAALAALWAGLSPDNVLSRHLYAEETLRYHPSFLTLYVCQLFIYLLPIVILSWRRIYTGSKVLLFSLIASGYYFLFPVRPCTCAVHAHVHYVGLFHRFLIIILGNHFMEDAVFYLAFLLSLPIIIAIVIDIVSRWRERTFDLQLLLDLSIISFLLVMQFPHYCWEKYFLPLLPLAAIRVLMIKYDRCQADMI